MKSASLDLANRLVVQIHRLRITDPAIGAVLSRGPKAATIAGNSTEDRPLQGPRLDIGRMYPNAVCQLIWPEVNSEDDAKGVVDLTGWVCLTYGIIGSMVYWADERQYGAVSILAFFAATGLAVRGWSLQALVSVYAFFVLPFAVWLVCYGADIVPLCLGVGPVLLLGAFRAIRYQDVGTRLDGKGLIVRSVLLAALTINAIIAICWSDFRMSLLDAY